MASRFSPRLFESFRNIGNLTSPGARSGQMIPGSIGNIAGERLGGLLFGRQASPQQQLQEELKNVEDKTSIEGLQKQAQIFANLGTPQAIELALQLQNRAATLSKTKTDSENLRKARVQITKTLGELGLKKERDLFTGGGLDLQDAQDIIKEELHRS